MREIKFRGKRVDNGEWVYGYYWRDNSNGKHKITIDLSEDNFRCHEVDPETVGEYIGLKDKSGKEIYEGDVISLEVYVSEEGTTIEHDNEVKYLVPPKEDYVLGVVEFYRSGFVMTLMGDEGKVYSDIEEETIIVGNIYENPELLNK